MDERTDDEIISQEVIPKTINFVCETLGSSLGLPRDATLFDLLQGDDGEPT